MYSLYTTAVLLSSVQNSVQIVHYSCTTVECTEQCTACTLQLYYCRVYRTVYRCIVYSCKLFICEVCSRAYRQLTQCSLQCKLYSSARPTSVNCTVYRVQCTLYSVHCTVYSAHCTVYTVHCTLYSVHCTVYSRPASLRQLRPFHLCGAVL